MCILDADLVKPIHPLKVEGERSVSGGTGLNFLQGSFTPSLETLRPCWSTRTLEVW
jgi:hypothetical protein